MTEAPRQFFWECRPVEFETADTVAAALDRAGILDLGTRFGGCGARYFCGIGACQACVVLVDGAPVEACLTPARAGQQVRPVRGSVL
ncbi:MAG: 2Fe-2S iron-sulfur cluster-binding protein [Devosia sp.]